MTATTAHAPSRAGLRVLLLAALAVLIALLLPAVTASAATVPAAQTGVGVSHPAATGSVGLHQRITAGQRRDGPRSQLQIVSGHCVAYESGCSYWQSVEIGLRGPAEVAIDAASYKVGGILAGKLSPLAARLLGRAAEDATGDASSTLSGPGPQGGESSAAAYGRAAHAAYDYGPGFEKEFVLENGQRADAVNLETREVVELKPNNRLFTIGGVVGV